MSDTAETIRKLQHGLQPCIKPREQANYIRRVLALHLGYCTQDGPASLPLALENGSRDVAAPGPEAKGLLRKYIEAVNSNVAARRQSEVVAEKTISTQEAVSSITASHVPGNSSNFLQDRIATLKLQGKRQRLSAVQKYLDILVEQPAAAHTFLERDQIFENAASLPKIPVEVVNGFAAGFTSATTEAVSDFSQLEKTVLRAKLLLQQEEKLLDEVKASNETRRNIVSNAARLDALNATRSELISWIERELSMVPSDDPEHRLADGGDEIAGSKSDPKAIKAGLVEIKEKYGRYLAARKELLVLLAQRPELVTLPPSLTPAKTKASGSSPVPSTYLLTPYVDSLLQVSREQKSTISQKSHINVALGKQAKATLQMLGRQAEESQLLPAYPMKDSLRRRSGLIDELTTRRSELPDVSSRVKPWIFAADSAKIANLESVAETVEAGQLAVESSMAALKDMRQLLEIDQVENQDAPTNNAVDDDFWLSAEGDGSYTRKHSTRRQKKKPVTGDIWSVLHGKLGLIGHEDLA
jgi:hypothetical protein